MQCKSRGTGNEHRADAAPPVLLDCGLRVAAIAKTIAATVSAIERVIAMPPYRDAALARAPAIARHDFGPAGAFMGYDFHLSPHGPRLIEINTNAGGALLNVALARAQQACCEAMNWAVKPSAEPNDLEQAFCEMFAAEWRRQRGNATSAQSQSWTTRRPRSTWPRSSSCFSTCSDGTAWRPASSTPRNSNGATGSSGIAAPSWTWSTTGSRISIFPNRATRLCAALTRPAPSY